ncbi:MAG: translation initiation factor IF-2 [Deferrisomatales bacterium]
MSKQEREARKAEKKAKKKKGVRREEVRPDGRRAPQKTQITVPKAIKRKIRVSEVITVSDLSQRMGVKATELIKKFMVLGVLVTINQTIDADTAALVASEFGYEIEPIEMAETEMLARAEDKPEDLVLRPPVVTVMGHVDHGKTSLLDALRETRVAAGEAGGITQHIGAYEVETSRGKVVFLDTPGHEAFTALRARGAKVTDITVLVVAAEDGIMPQTVEAIHHSRAAGVPIIVAINKMDKPDADPDRVKRGLAEHGLAPEDWGGDTICVPVSARKKTGLDTLVEMIALQAEMLELRANPNKAALGTVVEARVDRGRGVVATVLVQEGTLRVGDVLLAGQHYGRIRALINDQGKRVKEAGPSIPVEVTGMSGVPAAGEAFVVLDSERTAKEIASRRLEKAREEEMAKARRVSLADLHTRMAEGEARELPIIIKADVQGSVEALAQALEKISTKEVKVKVIHGAVGGITENDINLATASDAIVVGFNVRPESKAAALASQTGVDVRLYNVIYDATDDVKKALEGLLAPSIEERVLGRAEVRQIFKVPKAGTVAGCMVIQGVVQRNAKLRLLRDSVVVYQGELASLKRFKDDAKEVREGFDCGLSIQNYNDVKEGDVLEFYVLDQVVRTL